MNVPRNHVAATLTSMRDRCGITATTAARSPTPSAATKRAFQPMPGALPLPRATPAPAATLPPQVDSRDIPLTQPPAPGMPSMRLSTCGREVIARGPISAAQHVGGDAIGTLLGFGLGHLVRGRYSDVGVIFAAAEPAGLGRFISGAVNPVAASRCVQKAGWRGGIGSGVTVCKDELRDESLWSRLRLSGPNLIHLFRFWEIIDLSVAPSHQNRAYLRPRDKAERVGRRNFSIAPVILPNGVNLAMAGGQF